jgi:cysteine-rich repeat protein
MRTFTLLILVTSAACGTNNGDDGGALCGDSIVDPGEQCDDGNRVGGDGCSSICQTETPQAACGDGQLDADEACDDGNVASSDGCSATCTIESKFATTANWSFRDVATNTTTGCPVGFDTASVTSQLVDDAGTAVAGKVFVDKFNCADATGQITPVFQGRYQTFVTIENTDGTQQYAQTVSAIVDLTTADQTYTAEILNDGGYFRFAWTLVGATSNAPLTCAQVTGGVDSVESVVTLTSGGQAIVDKFDCADGAGVTAGFLAGSYTVSIDAERNNTALGTPQNKDAQLITAPNKLTDLGTINLPIDGQ